MPAIDPTADRPGVRPGAILAFLSVAQFVVFVNVSGVNLALPSIQDALGMSDVGLNYVVTASSPSPPSGPISGNTGIHSRRRTGRAWSARGFGLVPKYRPKTVPPFDAADPTCLRACERSTRRGARRRPARLQRIRRMGADVLGWEGKRAQTHLGTK